jgi:hypothetical protein
MKQIQALFGKASLVSVALCANALAHTQDGVLSPPAAIGDTYQVSCEAGTLVLEAQIRNYTKNSPLLTLQISKGDLSDKTTDLVSGDADYSPWIIVEGGTGLYSLQVAKTSSGPVKYSFEYHCMNGNTHTDTGIVMIGNDVPMSITPTDLPTDNNGFVSESTTAEGNEATTLYTGLLITPGCRSGGAVKPVIGLSVLFPTESPSVTSSDDSSITLDDVITAPSLANLPHLIQSRTVFAKQSNKTDASNNVIGLNSIGGKLANELIGVLPFSLDGIEFQPNSCYKSLTITLAVAEICSKTFPPQPGTANLWMLETTPTFADASIMGIGHPPTLKINRDLQQHPMDESCGDGLDAAVEPSAQDIDDNLPIPRFWKK